MRHLRQIVPCVLLAALCAPSVAAAHGPSKVGRLVPPAARVDGLTGGQALGLAWERVYTLPEARSPAVGNGEPCLRLGRTGSILVGVAYQPVPCTVKQGTTVLVWGIVNSCSDVEEEEFFAVGRAAQRRCASNFRPFVTSVDLTVDGVGPIHLMTRRFEAFSPFMRVQVQAGHPFYDAGPATFTAWGWVAWLKHLPPGRHTIVTETGFIDTDELHVISLVVDVVAHHGREGARVSGR
jgi:hypothetical protein